MKFALLLALLFTQSQALAADFLTPLQTSDVLQSIDNICGDSWCEGDFNYSFNELNCDTQSKSCELSFEFINGPYDDFTSEERLSVSCTITGVSSYEEMIEGDLDLVWGFYEKIGDCIASVEHLAYNAFNLEY